MAASLSFVQAQSQAIKFWGRNGDSIAERVTFLVEDSRGQRQVSFARDVDDYTVEPVAS